jgi:hypothetical protein
MTTTPFSLDDLPDLVRSHDVAARLTPGRDPDMAAYAEALKFLCTSGARRQHSPQEPFLWSIRDHAAYSAIGPIERFRAYRRQF